MAGQVLRVIPRQVVNFSYLAGSATETRVLVGKIPTARWTTGTLLVRVHTIDAGIGADLILKAE